MNILSFDTTNNLASVAIANNEQILSYGITSENSQQAEKLFELLNSCLLSAKLQLADINLISITNGPGSFTGVRIGLATALGMKTGCAADFIALTNFQVLAWHANQIFPEDNIAVIFNARRDQFYFQSFNNQLMQLTEPKLVSIDDILDHLPIDLPIVLVGDGVKLLPKISPLWKISDNLSINPNAEMLARASKFYWQNKLYHDLIPLYIREPDASLPRHC